METQKSYYITTEKMSVGYDGKPLIEEVEIMLRKGEILTLLGPNGAGKSTILKSIARQLSLIAGTVRLDGEDMRTLIGAELSKKMAVVMTKRLRAELMTCEDVVATGRYPYTGRFGVLSKDDHKAVENAMELVKVTELRDLMFDRISDGQRQRVMLARAICQEPEILILDEPTAVLTPDEVDGLFDMMNKLTSEGHTVIFISHKLNEIMKICDRCTVLRQGKLAATVEISEVHNRQELANLMVGHQVELKTERKPPEYTGERLRVEHLTCLNDRGLPAVKDVSFELQGGEILGVCGVDGNGQSELIQCITGLRKPSEGKIMICDTDTTNYTPKQILNLDVAHIPEDRHKYGMVGAMSIEENLILVSYDQKLFSLHKFLNWKWIADHSKKICQLFKVKTPTIKEQAINLSGGNQQKFVVGRELDRTPKLLVAVHPSRGLDIGATKYIQSKIMEQRDRGTAVLMVSTELDELIELSDRIMVMFEGRIMGIVDQKDASRETLGPMMAGLTEEK